MVSNLALWLLWLLWIVFCGFSILYLSTYMSIYYESQPVGLAEVIDASEASFGGSGRQTVANV